MFGSLFVAGALVICVLLGHFGLLPFLWVFPLQYQGFAFWVLAVAIDGALAIFLGNHRQKEIQEKGKLLRPLLWAGTLLWFTGSQGAVWLGLFSLFLPAFLWSLNHQGVRPVWTLCFLILLVLSFGHFTVLAHPGLSSSLGDWRLSVHLLSAFLFFRTVSWVMAVMVRGGQASFFDTLEYFVGPAFLLSPMHTSHLLWDGSEKKPLVDSKTFLWISRGILHSLIFGWALGLVAPWLQKTFSQGVSVFFGCNFLRAGAAIFFLAYFEKSRVSYLSAGFLRMSGFMVEPDFRSPWFAKSLGEYWRRFHFWIWEFYMDCLCSPLSAFFYRRLEKRLAVLLAVFFTFFLGTTLSHHIFYPAPILVTFFLAFLFGLFTVLHCLLEPFLKKVHMGLPITWLTVFFLYILAYPAFGLGWDVENFLEFFRR